jgi:4-amino-4-deoxy-L-arabinose transferase-like glycosyltransferase
MFSTFNIQFSMIVLLALGLRLLAWRWHELYDLGGDEREYFNQALTLLRDQVYVELNLMRPPLYTGFLAACMYVFDSLVQRLRLVQAVISALTVVPIYLLTQQLFGRRAGLIAALLTQLHAGRACHRAADRDAVCVWASAAVLAAASTTYRRG